MKVEGLRTKVFESRATEATKVSESLGRMNPVELRAFAQSIADLHKPVQFDWCGRFGVEHLEPPIGDPEVEAPVSQKKEKQKLICAECGASLSSSEARFCWFNKARFNGQIYCREHQSAFPVTKKGSATAS